MYVLMPAPHAGGQATPFFVVGSRFDQSMLGIFVWLVHFELVLLASLVGFSL